jgi:hypothetical protein
MSDFPKQENDEKQETGKGLDDPPCYRLVELCKELIGYLEAVEESDGGRTFHPTTIQSCRCLVVERLGKLIPEIKSICDNT